MMVNFVDILNIVYRTVCILRRILCGSRPLAPLSIVWASRSAN